jgi:hypothetical protein
MAKAAKAVKGGKGAKGAMGAKGAKGGKAATGGKKSLAGPRMIMTFALLALIPFSLPTMFLLFAGLLPTLVAALTDRSASRYAWICVGGLNFAGLVPALLNLWFGHHEINYALTLITTPRVMLMAYTAAAAGWGLYFIAPPVVLTILVATAKRRSATLGSQLKKLEDEWGIEVQGKAAAMVSQGGHEDI